VWKLRKDPYARATQAALGQSRISWY